MMSTSEQSLSTAEESALPNDITSPQAKLVYLAIFVTEEATATQLQELLGLSKLTLFAVLESLIANGHIQRTEGGYASR